MKRAALLVALGTLLFISNFASGQIYQHADSVFQLAKKSNRPILLFFSGSDWCPHCQRFENNILKDPAFMTYSREHLLVLQADFPQRKKQPAELEDQNEQLAEKYNPRGLFPTIVLLDKTGAHSAPFDYKNQDFQAFKSWVSAQKEILDKHE